MFILHNSLHSSSLVLPPPLLTDSPFDTLWTSSFRWYSETSQHMQTSRCHWHWFQTKWTYHFSPSYFNGIIIVTAFKCIFEETMLKWLVNFGNHISQDYHKTNIQVPSVISVLLHQNTVTKCLSNLPLKRPSFSLVTHTGVTVSSVQSSDSCSGLFAWNQLPRVGWKRNKMTSSLYQRITSKCHFYISGWPKQYLH